MSRRTSHDIDKSLKAAFDEAASQDVPDRFLDLLIKLRAAEEAAARKATGAADDDV